MSSILRALKKLDENAAADENQVDIETTKMKRVVRERAGSSRTVNRVVFAVSLLILLGITGWIVNKVFNVTEPPLDSRVVPALEKPESNSAGMNKQKSPTPPRGEGTPARDAGDEVYAEIPGPRTSRETVEPGKAAAPGAHSPLPEKDNKYRDGRDGIIENRKNTTSRPPATNSDPRSFSRQEKQTRTAKPPHFPLEGIVWSKTAKRRLALIDDQYYKEGETIKGAVIVRIEKKAMVIRWGDENLTIHLNK
ncbi:MAG: GspB domain-containing protein [bacterium]|nr:GspB domain-containing protein [bacterium]